MGDDRNWNTKSPTHSVTESEHRMSEWRVIESEKCSAPTMAREESVDEMSEHSIPHRMYHREVHEQHGDDRWRVIQSEKYNESSINNEHSISHRMYMHHDGEHQVDAEHESKMEESYVSLGPSLDDEERSTISEHGSNDERVTHLFPCFAWPHERLLP